MYWMKWGEEMVSLPVRVVAVVTAACASFPTNNWSLKDSSLFQLRHQWWMWNLVDSIFPRTKETELVKAWSHVAVPIQKFVCVCFFFFSSHQTYLLEWIPTPHSTIDSLVLVVGFPFKNLTKTFILFRLLWMPEKNKKTGGSIHL